MDNRKRISNVLELLMKTIQSAKILLDEAGKSKDLVDRDQHALSVAISNISSANTMYMMVNNTLKVLNINAPPSVISDLEKTIKKNHRTLMQLCGQDPSKEDPMRITVRDGDLKIGPHRPCSETKTTNKNPLSPEST